MIGDINIFINDEREGEINIMIAEPSYRNRGIAKEVITYIIRFSQIVAKLSKLIAKIHQSNVHSQKLFLDKGFSEFSRIPEFEEIHYQYNLE